MWSEYQRKPSCRLTKPQETADTYTAGQSRKLSNNSDTHRENLDLQTFCTDRSQLTARPKNQFTGMPLWIAQTDGKNIIMYCPLQQVREQLPRSRRDSDHRQLLNSASSLHTIKASLIITGLPGQFSAAVEQLYEQ